MIKKTKNIVIVIALLLFISAPSSWSEDAKVKEDTGQSTSAPSSDEPGKTVDDEKMSHDGMKETQGHKKDEMHGMMMGDHANKIIIIMGVMMVVMMIAVLL